MFVSPPQSARPADGALREANIALRNGDLDGARAAALRAVDLDPDLLEAWFVLGTTAMQANHFADAEAAFAEGIARVPKGIPTHAQLLTLRAQALVAAGRSSEAVDGVREALAIGIREASGLTIAATVLAHASLEAEALPLARRAAEINPNSPDVWFSLGTMLQFSGDLDGAEAAYEASIRCGLKTGQPVSMAPMSLARLKKWTKDTNHIARLEATQCRHSLDAACVAYALFKEYDDVGDTAAAWDALSHGAMIGGSIDPWAPDTDDAILKAWQDALPPERFAAPNDRPRAGPRRIFIVGLPRSGTTLVERILAAHSGVQALGELKTFGLAVKSLSGSATPALLDADTIAKASRLDAMALAEVYTRETAYLGDGSGVTIDKLPNNHDYAGLIRLAFPDAAIVHVRRNPMDSLFGAYRMLFSRAHIWSYSQDDLARHYDAYVRQMAWWRTCLKLSGKPLVEIVLEDIIRDPEAQIRRLLDLCDLDFEAGCLSPHEAKGAVATASSAQVRKPINAEGVGAWRRYAAELEPLRAQLQAMGHVDGNGDPVS